MKLLVFVLVASLSLTSCVKKELRPVLTVGQFEFTAEDLERRKKVLRFYYPNEQNPNVKRELTMGYTKVQALLDNGFANLRERVIAEEKRIDGSTLDPVGLAKIKRIFDNDVESYRRLYIVPLLSAPLLNELGRRHPVVQAQSKRKIEDFLAAVEKSPSQFATLAKSAKLERRLLRVSEEQGLRYDDAQKPEEYRDMAKPPADVSPLLLERWKSMSQTDETNEAQRWVREVAVSLKPGGMSPKIFDRGATWMAVRFIGTDKKTNDVLFETAEVAKDKISEWVDREIAKVKIVGE